MAQAPKKDALAAAKARVVALEAKATKDKRRNELKAELAKLSAPRKAKK